MLDENGRGTGWVLVARDVTDLNRQRTQLELLDLRERLYPDLPLGPPSEHLLPGS